MVDRGADQALAPSSPYPESKHNMRISKFRWWICRWANAAGEGAFLMCVTKDETSTICVHNQWSLLTDSESKFGEGCFGNGQA